MEHREKTVNEVFRRRVEKYGDRLAVRKKRNGGWETATWNEYYERARAAGLGLLSMGARKGDRVSILSENRLEWLYTDMGALGVGLCIVPIYATLPRSEAGFMVGNSGSKIIVVEDRAQLDKALWVKEQCADLEKIVVFNEEDIVENDPFVISFAKMMELGRRRHEQDPILFERLSNETGPEDLATIQYTSGTTGLPKGAVITHKNIISVLHSLHSVEPRYAYKTDHTAPFLPLSHVYGRIADHMMGMYEGITSSYVESISTIVDDIKEVRPNMVMAFPRVLEKVYFKILSQVESQSDFKQKIFFWGQRVGSEVAGLREKGEPVPALLNLKYRIAYTMIFKKLRNALGGRVRYMTASGGPTAREIQHFFNAAGIQVVEGYGMTEATAPVTMSNLAHYRIGTTGPAVPGLEIKIAGDGEILIKGDNVVSGYWNMPEETERVFDADGYFMTGDIGNLDENGFLTITDRKKDLIITAGGKNVAPQKIETLFMNDPLFSMFIVVGDKRKYLSALCNLNMEKAETLAKKHEIPYEKPEDVLENERFMRLVDVRIEEMNKLLARFETIKKYKIIKNQFSPETGELTNSFKVKRKVVHEKYKDVIDALYQEG
jgi:long-chain acyl-CoA synthetase